MGIERAIRRRSRLGKCPQRASSGCEGVWSLCRGFGVAVADGPGCSKGFADSWICNGESRKAGCSAGLISDNPTHPPRVRRGIGRIFPPFRHVGTMVPDLGPLCCCEPLHSSVVSSIDFHLRLAILVRQPHFVKNNIVVNTVVHATPGIHCNYPLPEDFVSRPRHRGVKLQHQRNLGCFTHDACPRHEPLFM